MVAKQIYPAIIASETGESEARPSGLSNNTVEFNQVGFFYSWSTFRNRNNAFEQSQLRNVFRQNTLSMSGGTGFFPAKERDSVLPTLAGSTSLGVSSVLPLLSNQSREFTFGVSSTVRGDLTLAEGNIGRESLVQLGGAATLGGDDYLYGGLPSGLPISGDANLTELNPF